MGCIFRQFRISPEYRRSGVFHFGDLASRFVGKSTRICALKLVGRGEAFIRHLILARPGISKPRGLVEDALSEIAKARIIVAYPP